MSKLSTTFQQLPPWAKGTVAVGVLIALGYVGYKIQAMPKGFKENKGNRAQENAEINEQNAILAQGKKPTLTKSQMQAIANAFFTAMDGYGTDEDQIILQFQKIKNDLDYLGVSLAYGIREVSSGRFNPEPNYKGNLTGALHSELSTYWLKKINEILKKNNVKYRV